MEKFVEIINKINETDNICLLVHESPDGDAIGSIIALNLAFKKIGKKVDAFIEKVPSNCEFLINSIGKDILTFDKMDLSKKYELCISLDCGDIDRMGEAKPLFENANYTICIDHHYTNNSYAMQNYVDGEAAATGELIYELLNQMNISLDKDIAIALYAAISSDTGNFKHNNTRKSTFEIAGKLIEYGIDITKISYHLFSETSLNRMKFMGKLLQTVEVVLDGKVGMLIAKQEDIDEFNVTESELEGMVDYARYIKGVEVGIFIKPVDGMYKVSLRSNGKVDVSGVASEFNGGGHKFAAGCKFRVENDTEVKEQLLEAFKTIINI